MHSLFPVSFPTQAFPPYCVAGLVHDLDLSVTPSPHVTEHALQVLQDVQSPSTTAKTIALKDDRRPSMMFSLKISSPCDLIESCAYHLKFVEKMNHIWSILRDHIS